MDLLRFHLATLFRIKANLYLFIFIWALVLVVIWAGHRDDSGDAWTVDSLIASLPMAIGAFTLFFSGLLFFALLGAVKNGIAGRYTYGIEVDGFRYITDRTNSITKWTGIDSARITGSTIYIRISAFQFCLLPQRVFETKEHFEQFYEQLISHMHADS